MTEKALKSVPLTPDDFRDFGAVLMSHGTVPQRDEFAGNVENRRDHAKANLTFSHVPHRAAAVFAVERHPYSSQTFVPMNGARSLIVVCPSMPDGQPDVGDLRVFVASGGQAVHYNAGTWHGPLCPLDQPGEYVMLRWDDGGPDDTELVHLKEQIEVIID